MESGIMKYIFYVENISDLQFAYQAALGYDNCVKKHPDCDLVGFNFLGRSFSVKRNKASISVWVYKDET
jgi:hypothetical protein